MKSFLSPLRVRQIIKAIYGAMLRGINILLRYGLLTPGLIILRAENYNLRRKLDVTVQELARTVVTQIADPKALATTPTDKVSSRKVAMRARYMRGQRARPAVWNPADPPAVSIVLGTYQRLPLLKKAIESIRNNGIRIPYEIIVVDGGSTDGTTEWLIAQRDIIAIVHHNRASGAPMRSWGWFMNIAFRAAHGRCILMMSDDCVLVRGAVEAGLARVAAAERAGRAVGGVAFYFRNWPLERSYSVQKTIGGMLMVNHGIFMRDALEAVGFCEEEAYGFYKCDSDLALKLWRAGYDVVDCPDAFVEHLMLPDEEVRLQNNKMMEHDREILLDRWDGIYAHRLFIEMFNRPERIEKVFDDPWNAAEALREFVPQSVRHVATEA